jgi:7,8-dihydro-6-hydroxymethylpterin dimethyltransferase
MDHPAEIIISETESVCPECFDGLPATVLRRGDSVFLRKLCGQHGEFLTLLWRGDPPYEMWSRPKTPFRSPSAQTPVVNGCPFDCGLCSDHRQQTCTALIEVTSRCNLRCAFCFADSGTTSRPDPDLPKIRSRYETLLANDYRCNIQLSGGEPTLRDDLPEIVALGRSMGFEFIQVNTNGLRLASDLAYLERLKEAGLSSVFLQFDGTENEIHRILRGGHFLDGKVQAIDNCRKMELGIVLVPTLVSEVNLHNVGEIISFALEQMPAIRGVHFQPVTYVGRYPASVQRYRDNNPELRSRRLRHPESPSDQDRLTLPDVMRAIELQTRGLIRIENLLPPGCENALCSFHGSFVVMPDGQVKALTNRREERCSCEREEAEAGAERTRQCVAEQWSASNTPPSGSPHDQISLGQWDVLLERAQTHRLSISAMAFQDAWNLDLDRLRDCCIHVAAQDGKVIPFCAYNLTSIAGRSLYRRN